MPIRRVPVNVSFLTIDRPKLVLDADVSSGSSSITVQSILGVAVNNLLLFRGVGSERSEIVAVHAVTGPSGNTVTLAANTVEAHPAGTVVYIISWNQVRFYHSATEVDANSDDSSLTALAAAQNIDPTENFNYYPDSAQTSGFYYYRFSDSIASVNDIYSDAIPWGISQVQFANNEVGYIIEFMRRKLGQEWNDQFSKQMAIDEITACLNYISGQLKRWARYLDADYALGQTSRGVFDYALPSTIYDDQTNKSILQVRLQGQAKELAWRDEKEFDNLMSDVIRNTVRTATVVNQSTLDVDNDYGFDASGTINIFTGNVDDSITYAAVTRSVTVGQFTGIATSGDSAITAIHAVGTNVWQNHQEGLPRYFNVREGRLRIWPLPDSIYINLNVFIDFYTVATAVDSESDTIDADRYDLVKHWLLWQGKNYWRNNGKLDLKDGDYLMFERILNLAVRRAISGQKYKMRPKINRIDYRAQGGGRFDYT